MDISAGRSNFIQVSPIVQLHVLSFEPRPSPSRRDANSVGTVVLVHGWPDFSYGWRLQIPALTQQHRVLVIDLPGFGLSSCPREAEHYTYKNLVSYLCTMLDFFNVPRAVFVGHDWGGLVVWHMAFQRPDRCIAVASLCSQFRPPTKRYTSPQEIAAKLPYFQYQVYFGTEAAVAEFDRDPGRSIMLMLHPPSARDGIGRKIGDQLKMAGKPKPSGSAVHGVFDQIPASITVADLGGRHYDAADRAAYTAAFKRTGFGPGFNMYRTARLNWEDTTALVAARGGEFRVLTPALLISAGRDVILDKRLSEGMEAWVPRLERGEVPDAGHFLQAEYPAETNALLVPWLDRVLAAEHEECAKLSARTDSANTSDDGAGDSSRRTKQMAKL
jgi:soluble epoxide hydrolase/lipid-phosphate phosphatase